MKKFKNLVTILTAASVILSLCLFCAPAMALEEPEVDAPSAILMELGSGKVMFEQEADDLRGPTSMSKIMTLLIACEAIERGEVSQDETVVITETVTEARGYDDSNVELTIGEEMSLLNLMYCAGVADANDAATAIAEHISGNIDRFVQRMNSRAADLGCENTTFMNPTGVGADGQFTTARDMCKIIAEAYNHELFNKISGSPTYMVPGTNNHIQRSLTNTNRLTRTDSEYYYANCVCGKSGYSDSNGHCLATVSTDEKLVLACVVMGAEYGRNSMGNRVYKNYTEARHLMDWGFENFSYRPILDISNLIADVPIQMGEGTDTVVLRPEKSITMLVENDVSTEDGIDYKTTIYSEENDEDLIAPVNSGDVLGEVEVFYKNQSQGVVKLVANSTVPLMRSEYIKSEFKKGMASKYIRHAILFIILVVGLYVGYIVYYNSVLKNNGQAPDRPVERVPQAAQQRPKTADRK